MQETQQIVVKYNEGCGGEVLSDFNSGGSVHLPVQENNPQI